jgi:membrane protein implicated in regulation of membrane protease activity
VNALNVVCMLLVAVALAVAVAVVYARLVRRREAREDREDYAARALRRDFARSVADGFVELPTGDPKPAPLRLPEETP